RKHGNLPYALVASLVPPAHKAGRLVCCADLAECPTKLPTDAALHKTNCYVSLTNRHTVLFAHHPFTRAQALTRSHPKPRMRGCHAIPEWQIAQQG
ncbi:MAG TPA: hypothetical protein VLA37_06775, partial [Sphingomonadaceae bacterium]|nr:hypothetical protein [Sphingomonadaceae bacterium]